MIGSYNSNSVYLLLSRPIINITTRVEDALLQAVDPGQAGCFMDPESQYTCFHFSACFDVSQDVGSGMMIRFKIIAEPNKPVSRVWMRLSSEDKVENRTNIVEHDLFIQE